MHWHSLNEYPIRIMSAQCIHTSKRQFIVVMNPSISKVAASFFVLIVICDSTECGARHTQKRVIIIICALTYGLWLLFALLSAHKVVPHSEYIYVPFVCAARVYECVCVPIYEMRFLSSHSPRMYIYNNCRTDKPISHCLSQFSSHIEPNRIDKKKAANKRNRNEMK